MKKNIHQEIISKIRKKTPLFMRHKIGPIISRFLYKFNKYILKNSNNPRVMSIDDTIDSIFKEKASVIRFGDGEISLMDGDTLGFQDNNQALAEKLEMIFKQKHKKLLICIPDIWERIETLEDFAYNFNIHHLYRYGHIWRNLLDKDVVYGNTFVTRPYLCYKNKSDSRRIFNKIFSMWKGENVVLIEGSGSRLGVGNDLFNEVLSLGRIICPPENAFLKYEEIKKEALKIDKDKLILLSLGPTAKVLAYDLFLLGYRVIDIGHIDMEYEMFIRGEKKLTKVPNKYFNEINERTPGECNDASYLESILVKIE